MRLTQTVAFRLFLLIVSVQTIILAALTFATVRIQQSHLMENVILSATRVSDIIARSTRYSMLLNRKEDVHNIISSVGGEPGIEGIRIYNKQGEIVFATVPADIHASVDMNAEACVSCHAGQRLDQPRSQDPSLLRIFTKPGGSRVLGLITPIPNDQQCATADCHAHPETKTILGVLDVKMSLVQVDTRLAESRNKLVALSLGAVFLVSLISGGFIWIVVRKPVKRLVRGMEMVSSGQLHHRLEATSKDELGQLAATFNSMTSDLAKAREEITAWSSTLEDKVVEKTAALERAHRQMITVEKMASLGELASTVAHELNNPLEGILTFAKLLIKRIQKSTLPQPEVNAYHDDLKLVADEAQRCGTIVKNLLLFSRQKGGAFRRTQLKSIIDRCALLMNHHAQMHNVSLTTVCADDLVLECEGNQIQQALIALMVNAVESMSSGGIAGGTLRVLATGNAEHVMIRIVDSGVGITDEIKAHMFEPFFTTKPEGKGVGLGLAVVYGIVERHQGTMEVDSTPRCGATFIITLPIRQAGGGQDISVTSSQGVHNEQE